MDAVSCGYDVDLMREVNIANSKVFVLIERKPVLRARSVARSQPYPKTAPPQPTTSAFYRPRGLVRYIKRRHGEALSVINAAILACGGAKVPW